MSILVLLVDILLSSRSEYGQTKKYQRTQTEFVSLGIFS